MTEPRQGNSRIRPSSDHHYLIFDSDCGFCTNAATWLVEKSDNTKAVPYQDFDYLSVGLSAERVSTAAYFIDRNGRVSRGAGAIGRALLTAHAPWKFLGLVLVIPPFSWVGRACYPIIARYRGKLPGGTASCSIKPTTSEKDK